MVGHDDSYPSRFSTRPSAASILPSRSETTRAAGEYVPGVGRVSGGEEYERRRAVDAFVSERNRPEPVVRSGIDTTR